MTDRIDSYFWYRKEAIRAVQQSDTFEGWMEAAKLCEATAAFAAKAQEGDAR